MEHIRWEYEQLAGREPNFEWTECISAVQGRGCGIAVGVGALARIQKPKDSAIGVLGYGFIERPFWRFTSFSKSPSAL